MKQNWKIEKSQRSLPMWNIFKMLFFDALYGGPIVNGFGFLVTLHDSRNPFRGTVISYSNTSSDMNFQTILTKFLSQKSGSSRRILTLALSKEKLACWWLSTCLLFQKIVQLLLKLLSVRNNSAQMHLASVRLNWNGLYRFAEKII